MTPFRRVQYDAVSIMATRNDLLAKPCEFFSSLFQGRIPTLPEKLALVEQAIQRMVAAPVYQNDKYTVQVETCAPFIHLNIRRNDWSTCKDWREFQQIKNMLVGTENEAVELFPAESRLVDTANVYPLWVLSDPSFRFPLGLPARLVTSEPVGMDQQRAVAA